MQDKIRLDDDGVLVYSSNNNISFVMP